MGTPLPENIEVQNPNAKSNFKEQYQHISLCFDLDLNFGL